ncbi:MAG: hypothetical protein ILP16_07010 [Spirochaetales bacterium]|nr:hypothetical protein [Spirochaetales bacterium]
MTVARRLSVITILAILTVVLAGCASTGAGGSSGGRTFVDQFAGLESQIQVDGNIISLKKDIHLPAGKTLVLDSGETWNLNLNGHTIMQDRSEGRPVIEIVKGTLSIVNGDSSKYHGGIISSDGPCLRVGKGASLIVNAGTIVGDRYAIEVLSGGNLKVNDGRIQADTLPILVNFGWSGNLSGGLYSKYDTSYDQAILGKYYASSRVRENDKDFKRQWPDSFTIVEEGAYKGESYLRVSTTSGYSACFRLYKTREIDEIGYEGAAIPMYEWLVYPGQVKDLPLIAGNYILKVAEGYDWTDDDAFGNDGVYWYVGPYEFTDGYLHSFETRGGTANYPKDTKEGFLNGR